MTSSLELWIAHKITTMFDIPEFYCANDKTLIISHNKQKQKKYKIQITLYVNLKLIKLTIYKNKTEIFVHTI